jgi:Putative Actinobacterial Holin-X, holin superfamily III
MMSSSSDAPSTPASASQTEPELKAIVADLWHNSERLVQQELQLAVSELNVRVDKGKRALRTAAIAGGLFHAAYLTTLATLVLLLSQVLAPWLAAFLVALAASAGAYAFSWRSKRNAQQAAHPPETLEPFTSSRRIAHSQGASHVSAK